MPLTTYRDVSGVLEGATDALLISVIATDDLNGDGYGDLIIAGGSAPNEGTPTRQGLVYFGDGRGGFSLADQTVFPWQTLKLTATSQIVSADFNRDGRLDVFVATFGKDGDPFPGEQNRLYLSTTGGRWVDATATLPQLNDNTHRVSVGDINGDGAPDIYVGNIYGQQKISPYVLINDGSGIFTRNNTIVPAGPGEILSIAGGTNMYTGSKLADLDGDGRVDLVLGSFGGVGAQSFVLWNAGAGYSAGVRTTLPPGQLADTNRNVLDIETLDFNRDGKPDILVFSAGVTFATDLTPTYRGWTLDIYRNEGNRTFSLATSQFLTAAQSSDLSSSAGGPTFIDLLDVNKDGLLDIVFVLEFGGPTTTPYVLLNSGNGGFGTITRGDLSSNAALSERPVPIVEQSGVSFYAFTVRGGQIGYFAAQAAPEGPTTTGNTTYVSADYTQPAESTANNITPRTQADTFALNITGNANAQTIIGNYGPNILTGGGGADTLIGLRGNDTYVVSTSNTVVVENLGEGTDTVSSSVSYILPINAEIEFLSASVPTGTAPLYFTGNPFDQRITGNNGDNIINGLGGSDTMVGLGGNDTYLVRGPGDVVIEANVGGFDTVYTTVSYNLGENEVEVLSTVTQTDTTPINLIGNFVSQFVVGNYGDNLLNGGSGVDTLVGLFGNDLYAVGDSRIVIVEADGQGVDTVVTSVNYTLGADVSAEVLSAQIRSSTTGLALTGNRFAQTIAGTEGADTINGGAGNDVLIGGGGADRFDFTTLLNATTNVDAITDFGTGDRIGLSAAIFAGIGTALDAGEFVIGTAAADADDRIIYNQATGQLSYDADGNGAGLAVLFAVVTPGTIITSANFDVIAP